MAMLRRKLSRFDAKAEVIAVAAGLVSRIKRDNGWFDVLQETTARSKTPDKGENILV